MPTDVVYLYDNYINYQYMYHIMLYIQVSSMYIAYLKMKHVSFDY